MNDAYSVFDGFIFPFFALLLYVGIKKANERLDLPAHHIRLLNKSLGFRILLVLAFFYITVFYYGFGDSLLYYSAVTQLHDVTWEVKEQFLTSITYTPIIGDRLFGSFSGHVGYYMLNPANALVVKVGYYASLICFNSYITICLLFSVFAYLGCRKMFLLFTRFYPTLYREFAMAILFIPSVVFWSSGLLKDSLTLGALGFLIYYGYRLVVDVKQLVVSVAWITISVTLLLMIKSYIIMAILPGFIIWLFLKKGAAIQNPVVRRNIKVVMLVMGTAASIYLINYLASTKFAEELATEKLDERIMQSQQTYTINIKGESYYQIDQKNMVLAFPLGIVATLFRPFLWEVKSFVMLISSLESVFFSLVTLLIWFRIGFLQFFKLIFKNADTLFFFIFAMLFAGAVGLSTPNFGTLGRYKIPCLPFYLMMLFIIMHQVSFIYPHWLNKIINRTMGPAYQVNH